MRDVTSAPANLRLEIGRNQRICPTLATNSFAALTLPSSHMSAVLFFPSKIRVRADLFNIRYFIEKNNNKRFVSGVFFQSIIFLPQFWTQYDWLLLSSSSSSSSSSYYYYYYYDFYFFLFLPSAGVPKSVKKLGKLGKLGIIIIIIIIMFVCDELYCGSHDMC